VDLFCDGSRERKVLQLGKCGFTPIRRVSSLLGQQAFHPIFGSKSRRLCHAVITIKLDFPSRVVK
jgi:hypothetical protein